MVATWSAAAVVLAGALFAAVFFVLPSRGTLLVTVSGPGDVAVDALKVWVDGEEMCSGAPCKVSDIQAGAAEAYSKYQKCSLKNATRLFFAEDE